MVLMVSLSLQDPPHPIPNHEGTRLGVSVHMSSRNRSFGFQVVGGLDAGISPQVELVLPGQSVCELQSFSAFMLKVICNTQEVQPRRLG